MKVYPFLYRTPGALSTSFLLSTLFLILFSIQGLAQADIVPARIDWGPEFEEPNNSFISKVIPAGKNFYAIRHKMKSGIIAGNRKVFIEKFNENMDLVKSQDINLSYKNKQLNFEDMIIINNNLFLLSSFHNKAKKKNYLFSQMINMRTLNAGRTLKKLGEIETKGINRTGSFGINISRDSSKVLIYNELPYKKGKPERFSLKVYNDNFDEVWSRNIRLPYNDDKFAVEEYRVDKDGNVYMLGVIYEDKSRRRRRGRPTYQYVILAYTADGGDAERYKIDLRDKFITDLTFRVADDGNLVCSGFFSEKGNYSIKGTYFFRLDPTSKEIYNRNLKEFNFEFVTDFMSDRKKEKARKAKREGDTRKEAELYSYSLDRLVLRNDGGALLIAEQYFVQQRDNSFNNFNGPFGFNNFNQVGTGIDFHYHYNDIIIVNIRPDGEIEWASRIPKRQETVNDGGYYSSYSMSIVRDKIFFVFNDNARNYQSNRRAERIYNFNGNRSIIALAAVSRDGSVETYPLFSNREAGTLTRPKICKQTGRSKMVIYGERGRRYRFANLEFIN